MKTITYDPTLYKLAPIEPTEEMYAAASDRIKKNTVETAHGTLVRDPVAHTWIAMLNAAPAALEAQGVDARDAAFDQECRDVDTILWKLGLDPEAVRTDGGYLNVPRILNHIQETLDALVQATNFGAEMSDKYVKACAAMQSGGEGK